MRLGAGESRLVNQQRRQHLACLLRLGIGGKPDAGGFDRGAAESRIPGDFRRTLRNARIARFARKLKVGLHGDIDLPALQRDVCKQQPEQDRLA